ncbi:WYL domain-containing protein [Pseudomonas sp. MWU12-2323]|uniref:YafY family transcriptional regulator n=1 Tax=Pseudomonas gingeri TaxID=117681 RepID=A0A7Y7WRP4_9PSED|nr:MULTISPECIES: YafY family protein [Pseudomonas]MPQ68766.1 WYL domain-containing protein [Pseudomonas sp. MWU12-2323]NWB86426.1 YafY family transcriptional regulator [Pseudomonas gingeri]RBH54187.1 YafY family transcriptional regulator [Pseudomonas sp. MWU13-2860]
MSRSQRLLALIQILRCHRFPVAGAVLAQELGITLRSLYRDIGTLKEQGANIEGVAGLGFVLHPGFLLPPLMFSEEEIEALVLGSRWVVERADERLGRAARNALDKISAVLPSGLRDELDASALLIGPSTSPLPVDIVQPLIRQAIRAELKVDIVYQDLKGEQSCRIIWPFALGYFDEARVLVAWCELREGFRHFRSDRITEFKVAQERYPRRRQALLKAWRLQEGIRPQ